MQTIEIELNQHFPPQIWPEVEAAFEGDDGKRLSHITQAILLAERGEYFEKLNGDFKISFRHSPSQLKLILEGVPKRKLVNGKLVAIKEMQIIAGFRDLLLSRVTKLKSNSEQDISEYIFNFVLNANLLGPEDLERNPYGRVMIQGGHRIPDSELRHHKRLGYGLGQRGIEIITGSGPGSMEAPFKGASRGYLMNRLQRKSIGLTEDGIISGEPCNDYIDHLIVFPDIEKRMEAFIRMSRAGIVLPGGTGTLEEILTILWVKNHPRNQEFRFPLYFVQPIESGSYFSDILDFLTLCFDRDFTADETVKLRKGSSIQRQNRELDPKRIGAEIFEEMKENRGYLEKEAEVHGHPISPMWNWDLHYPHELQTPLEITHEFMESLVLDRNQPTGKLFFALRAAASALVFTNVKDRGYLDRHGPFRLKGDKEILRALDELFVKFAEAGRMGGREYRCPYVI